MLDSRRRFSKNATLYDKYRPSYPPELIEWIIKVTALPLNSTVADIGCGTGISTRLFSNSGFNLIGIDPNKEMLSIAKKKGGAIYSVGEAEATGLPKASCDLIFVAQAFHWFNLEPTLKEFARILKPQGWCAAFWNDRQETPFLHDYEMIIQKYSSDYSKIPKPVEVIQAIKHAKDVKSFKESQFQNNQRFSLRELIGYVDSNSYIAHGVENRSLLHQELAGLFQRHKKQEHVGFDFKTIAICWQM